MEHLCKRFGLAYKTGRKTCHWHSFYLHSVIEQSDVLCSQKKLNLFKIVDKKMPFVSHLG